MQAPEGRQNLAQLKEMKALFAEHDVEGLIAEGAPRDEYDHEATDVAQKLKDIEFLKEKIDHSAILKVLTDVWGKSFNLQGAELEMRRENLSKMAGRIEEMCRHTG
jgi:hypothetical protein